MTPKILSTARDSFKVGDRVRVFDRYQLALPCTGTVHRTEGVTEGCLVLLDKGSHGKADERFPDGIYVCFEQLRSTGTTMETMTLKILTPAEALRALADGKRLAVKGCASYIWLDRGVVVWSSGHTFKGGFNELIEYTEPKPKVVWVEYLVWSDGPQADVRWIREGTPASFGLWLSHPTGRKIEV